MARRTKDEIKAIIARDIVDNDQQQVSVAEMRAVIIDIIDSYGTSDLTAAEAQDLIGAMFARLDQFTYDAATKQLTFVLDAASQAIDKLARSQAPVNSLKRQAFDGKYTNVTYNETAYDAHTIGEGQFMVSEDLGSGDRGVLIGLKPADQNLLEYLSIADDNEIIDYFTANTDSATEVINGVIDRVDDISNSVVLVIVQRATLGSISAGDEVDIFIENRTLAFLNFLRSRLMAGDRTISYYPPARVSGSAIDIFLTSSPPISNYQQGFTVIFAVKDHPTGNVTIDVDNLGAKPLLDERGRTINQDYLFPGEHVVAVYAGNAFYAFNKDILEESRIASLTQVVKAINTPRRGGTLPHVSQHDELFILEVDGPQSETTHDWTFDTGADTGSSGRVIGAGIAGAVPGIDTALGTDLSAIFQASGIRAVYALRNDRNYVYVTVARALISDQLANALNTFYVSVSLPQSEQSSPLVLAGVADNIVSDATTRTLRFPIQGAYDTFANSYNNAPVEARAVVSLRRVNDFLHINSGTVEFGGAVIDIPKGLYQGTPDGKWEQRALAKPPRVLQAAVNASGNNGVAALQLPTDYTTYRKVALVVWATSNNTIMEVELHTAFLAVQTRAGQRIGIGNTTARGGLVVIEWTTATRTITGDTDERIIYAELED